MKKQVSKTFSKVESHLVAQKILEGVVVSTKMQKTVVVKIPRIFKHPMYRKLIKKDKKLKADTGGLTITVNDKVKVIEISPLSKTKCFKILEVVKK